MRRPQWFGWMVAGLLLGTGAQAQLVEMVDNPQYKSWASYKEGTNVVLEMAMNAQGRDITMKITQTLIEVTPEKAVLEIKNTPDAASGIPAGPPQRVDVKAKVSKEEAELGSLPPGAKGSSKEVGSESVEAAGKSYTCKVTEFSGDFQGVKSQGKVWRSDSVPGLVVKTEVKFEGAESGSMAMKLVSADVKQ